jgi:hypothetical protein
MRYLRRSGVALQRISAHLENSVVNTRYVFSIPIIMSVKFLADMGMKRGEKFSPSLHSPPHTKKHHSEKKRKWNPQQKNLKSVMAH